MKCFREVTISSAILDESLLVHYIESFAAQSDNWHVPKAKSAEYARLCGAPSCCLLSKRNTLPPAVLHLSTRKSGGLYVTNIVPLKAGQLSLSEYNSLIIAFAQELRAKSKADGIAIRITQSKETVTLRDLITGKISRKLFNQYVNAYPLSGHSADTKRLDKFICSIARYSRRPVDLDAFQQLLAEELKWPKVEAEKCRKRVEIGLEVLAVYKKF